MRLSGSMNVLVGVCGSIAAYKAFDLVRGLSKNGHRIRVILSAGALEFVRPEVFKHLGAEAVYLPQDDHKADAALFEGLDSKQVLHIALVRWAQQFIIAPMTANTLNKLASGLADDLLSCSFLAAAEALPKLLFPAMNPAMWENSIVKKNRAVLESLPNTLVHATGSGEMVCGEHGDGKLATVDEILALSQAWLLPSNSKRLLVTTGATIAPLDPIRFLTNSSSGETGYVFAREALAQGFHVDLIAGKNATQKLDWLLAHPRFNLIRITTTQNMRDEVLKRFGACDVYISSAAIGDIHFETSDHKIKKDQIRNQLSVFNSPDILKEVVSLRTAKQMIIGFAAETELTIEVLEKKWQSKPVDLLVGTLVGHTQGFGQVDPHYMLYLGNKNVLFNGQLSKTQLAQKILEIIAHDQSHSLHV